MDCKTASDLLPRYFDAELDGETSRRVEAHLDDCAECRADLIDLDSVRRALRYDARRYAAPALLRQRVQGHNESAAALLRARHGSTRWLAIAASWLVAFAMGAAAVSIRHDANLGARTSTASTSEQITRDLFASHWRALAATSPVDVVSTDRHTVKPWFAGKVNSAPLVQDFTDQGFSLVGGRIDYIGSARVAVLVYRHAQHLIDVFILPRPEAGVLGSHAVLDGYSLDTVLLADQPAAIVSDMDPAELAHFSQLLSTLR